MLCYLMAIESPADQTKFEKIYQHYKGLMFHVANEILQNEEDAEDAVHNAFVKIAKDISKIEDVTSVRTQHNILQVAESEASDLYRKKHLRNKTKYLEALAGLIVPMEGAPSLAYCMGKLPGKYREVLLLKHYHGLSFREIAELLHLSQDNVYKLHQRAKSKLQQICEEEGVL